MPKKQITKSALLLVAIAVIAVATILIAAYSQSNAIGEIPALSIPMPGNEIPDISYSFEMKATNAPLKAY